MGRYTFPGFANEQFSEVSHKKSEFEGCINAEHSESDSVNTEKALHPIPNTTGHIISHKCIYVTSREGCRFRK
jgi:hypothetical protein